MMLVLLFIVVGIVGAEEYSETWSFEGVLGAESVEEPVEFTYDDRTIFHVESSCAKTNASPSEPEDQYIQYKLYETSSLKTIIFGDVVCDGASSIKFSQPDLHVGDYQLAISGKEYVEYSIEVTLNKTKIDLEGGKGEVAVKIPQNQMIIQTFNITDEDIKTTSSYSYIQVTVNSDDKYIDETKTGDDDTRFVAILMVTQDPTDLSNFYDNPDADRVDSMRLSFSTFGRITISNASYPPLATGTWLIGMSIKHNIETDSITRDKKVDLSVNIRTDYAYRMNIGVLFIVSLLGLIIPMLARVIFDAGHLTFSNFKWECWFLTLKNWFWSGRKGLTYLTTLLAALLIVSAFQVVHAKYSDMTSSGNRDTCYYNEKCYRPYGDYYDVSVNNIASNLPFMVHGVILVIYFSFSEAYCRSNDHKHFDYSIPYSFGLAFICEGFGSLLYHICPSQIIFQFDTLFMFVITIIMIIGIFEGHSIRENDRFKYSMIAKHKSIRTPKVFAFFVGPVYYFNFIGNLIATDAGDYGHSHYTFKIFNHAVRWNGLPVPFTVVFYLLFGIWWLFILSWAAYKLDLWPDAWDPKTNVELEEIHATSSEAQADASTKSLGVQMVLKHRKTIKAIAFGMYCVLVAVGFVAALLQLVAFSIFILGILVVAVIILTLIFFIPLMWTVIQFFLYMPLSISHKTYTCKMSKHVLVIFGIIIYVFIGCAVTFVSLLFFTYFSVTDKSISAARSRELNNDCYLNNFYDTHDFWHLFASFALMMMTMLNVQISKPCRDCYLVYLERKKNHVRKMTLIPGKRRKPPTETRPADSFDNPSYAAPEQQDNGGHVAVEQSNHSAVTNVEC